jgi:hypothetical protein
MVRGFYTQAFHSFVMEPPFVLPHDPLSYLKGTSVFDLPFRALSIEPLATTLIIQIPPLSPGGFECEIPVKFPTSSLNEYVDNGFITIPVTLLGAAAWNTLSRGAFALLYEKTFYPVLSALALPSEYPEPSFFWEAPQDEDDDEQKQPNPFPFLFYSSLFAGGADLD